MITNIESTSLNTQVAATVQVTTMGNPGPQGPQGASAQASSVVVLTEDAVSVTVLLGEYVLLGVGEAPYPHVILRTAWG